MPTDFDPYHVWLGIAPVEQPPHHYRLLGVPLFESKGEVIGWQRGSGGAAAGPLLSDWPVACSRHWLAYVNDVETERELAALRRSVQRGCPYGSEAWSAEKVRELGLEHSIRAQGRPRKETPSA